MLDTENVLHTVKTTNRSFNIFYDKGNNWAYFGLEVFNKVVCLSKIFNGNIVVQKYKVMSKVVKSVFQL